MMTAWHDAILLAQSSVQLMLCCCRVQVLTRPLATEGEAAIPQVISVMQVIQDAHSHA
jgi:hypothetical protein